MPKTSAPQPRQTSIPSDLDVDSLQLSESHSHDEQPPSPKTAAVLRRRKNADAQAAFRARRTQYIANLEETGESFVRSLPINFIIFSEHVHKMSRTIINAFILPLSLA